MTCQCPPEISQTNQTGSTDDADFGILEKLNSQTYLVSLNIGWPKLARTLKEAIVEVAYEGGKEAVPQDLINKPQLSPMPDHWRTRLGRIETGARKALLRKSVSFGTNGICVVPIRIAPSLFAELREFRSQLEDARDEFLPVYPVTLKKIRDELPTDIADRILRTLPHENQIGLKFHMQWSILPLGASAAHQFKAEELQQIMDETSVNSPAYAVLERLLTLVRSELQQVGTDTAAELIGEAKHQMRLEVRQAMLAAADAPREELRAAISHVLESAKSGKNIQNGSLESIRAAWDKLRAFDFIADDRLLRQLSEGEYLLREVDARSVNQRQGLGVEFLSLLQDVVKTTVEQSSRQRSLQKFRRLSI